MIDCRRCLIWFCLLASVAMFFIFGLLFFAVGEPVDLCLANEPIVMLVVGWLVGCLLCAQGKWLRA